MESKKIEFFNSLSFTTILVTVFLSLFFFIPYTPVTLEASKGFLVSIGATLSLFFWLIARLGEGKFLIPKDRIILYAGLIPLVFLVSSLFSSSVYVSLFGSGFEIGTFGSMLVLFVFFFLSSIYFQTEKRLWYFFSIIFIGAIILSLFELINIFIGFESFAPGFLRGISFGNLVGSWNDFGLLFGLIVLLSIFTIEFLRIKGFFLVIQYFLLVTGLFFLILINIPLVWILVGLFSVIIFVYNLSIQQSGDKKRFPLISLIVIFMCFIFLIGSNSIGELISRYVNLQNNDVRPLVSTTFDLTLKAINHNPLLGTGPNTFALDWALWQPKVVAQSIYWNVDFTNGFSSLFTFAVTTGLLGIFVWILFLVTFSIRGVKSFYKVLHTKLSNYFTIATLIIATYSWITIIIYTPNVIMFTLAFVSSGILVGVSVYNKTTEVRSLSFLKDPRHSFFSILVIMALMIVTLSTTYVYAEKFASLIYFSKSSINTNTIESLSKSEKMLSNAILLDQNDVYYRAMSQVYMSKLSILLNDKNISQDTLKSELQKLINFAESSALSAVAKNKNQYLNHLNLGNLYSSLVPLSIANSYENAVSSYDKARELAPNNPSILLSRASLEILNKNNSEARKFIDQALLIKTDYTDAVFLLAQIETDEGNLLGAISQAERAAQLTPNDSTVFFRLGLLRYSNSDYKGAISAFERAVILESNYFNARFFLGQSYQKVGRTSDALVQFNLLTKALPDNQDVKNAINSINNPPIITPQTPTNTKTPTTTKLPLSGQR